MRLTKRRVLRATLVFALCLLVLDLGLQWLAHSKLRRAIAEAPGLHRRMAELVPPAIPREQNASAYMNAAAEVCLAVSAEEWGSFGRPERPQPALWRRMVTRNRLPLTILEAARGCERAWFETHYGRANPFEVRLPAMQERRWLAHTLRARALLAAYEGRSEDAYHDVLLLLRLGTWCGQEQPFVINAMTGLKVWSDGLRTLEQVMGTGAPSPTTRQALVERLDSMRADDPVRWALDGERTAQFGLWEGLASGAARDDLGLGDWGESAWGLARVPLRFYLRLDQAAGLRAMTELLSRCDQTTAELRREGRAGRVHVPSWAVITRMMVVSNSHLQAERDKTRGEIDLARLALQAAAHEREKGRYPAPPLSAWGTGNLVDPRSGERYVYSTDAHGFRLEATDGGRTIASWAVAGP